MDRAWTQRWLRGILLPLESPCSIQDFLCEKLGLAPEYVENRITTVFLDGKVVDDLEQAMLRNGSKLALSAAMPGLAGASLRRNGAYAALRQSISQPWPSSDEEEGGFIQVKLFNLLIAELGPLLRKKMESSGESNEKEERWS